MKKTAGRWSYLCGAGAELAWMAAWSTFILLNCFDRIYPLSAIVATFAPAAALTRIPRGRGWRVIQVIGLHLIGSALSGLWIVHFFYYSSDPLWSRDWVNDFFSRSRDSMEWFLLVFVLSYTFGFWIAGIRFELQKKSYGAACTRFDRGLLAFFFLFLIKLMLQSQMGAQFKDTFTIWMTFPFFIFGLAGIGLSKNLEDEPEKDFLSGYGTLGILIGFAFGVLVLGAGLFLFFYPFLRSVSMAGYDLIKTAATPLVPILIAILRFVFGYAGTRPAPPARTSIPAGEESLMAAEPGGWWPILEKIIAAVGAGVVGIAAIAGACILLAFAVRWLFSRQPHEGKESFRFSPKMFWMRIRLFFCAIFGGMLRGSGKWTARGFYAALLRWGKRSGLVHAPSETPMEYSLRLALHFPRMKDEIRLVVDLFQREVYGESTPVPEDLKTIRRGWRRLRSPSLWLLRLKTLLIPTHEEIKNSKSQITKMRHPS